MNVELVAQMFKNYQSNVLFHLEGAEAGIDTSPMTSADASNSNGQPERTVIASRRPFDILMRLMEIATTLTACSMPSS